MYKKSEICNIKKENKEQSQKIELLKFNNRKMQP